MRDLESVVNVVTKVGYKVRVLQEPRICGGGQWVNLVN